MRAGGKALTKKSGTAGAATAFFKTGRFKILQFGKSRVCLKEVYDSYARECRFDRFLSK